MAFCKTQGVVVRKVDFSETSLILTFLTREHGKVQTLAKGGKRFGKKMSGVPDVACLADIVFLEKQSDLHTLTEWEVKDYFPGLRRSLGRLYAADYAVELVRDSTEQQPCPEVFDLLVLALRGFAETRELTTWIFAFEVRLLAALGYMPQLERCTACSGELGRQVYFTPAQGGVVCPACKTDDSLSVTAGSVATIRTLAQTDSERLDRLRMAPKARREIQDMIRRHIEYTMGRQPRLWPHLAQ